MNLELKFTFDETSFRHFVNGHATVLHCHHYMSLTTRLADEYAKWEGPRILAESAEDAIFPVIESYLAEKSITDVDSALEVGCEYYCAMGLGRMKAAGTSSGGSVELARSHVDEGWIKKFGKSSSAINYFTRGYIAGMFSAAFRKRPRSYSVSEAQSIAKGDAISQFEVRVR